MAVQVILIEPSRTSNSIGDKGPPRTFQNGEECAERECSSESFPLFLQIYSPVKCPIATEDMVPIPSYPIKLNIIATVRERLKSGYELFVTKTI